MKHRDVLNKLFNPYHGKLKRLIIVLLACGSLWQFSQAGWIQGKAIIAQQLLSHSWNQSLKAPVSDNPGAIHKPWPWADTWPVAKLTVPKYDIEQIVLAGDSGSSLAFGPGYSMASAAPNTTGLTMISAHRDTHFRFLKELEINDMLFLQTTDKTIPYRVYDMEIVDSKTHSIQESTTDQILVLVTCYPFDAITPGGSSRYLVYAARSQLKII